MFRSVCLIGAVVLMASSALADTACGTAPLADAMVSPSSVSGKTAEEALKIKHEAYVSVTSYQAKLKIFRELNKINRLPGYSGPPSPAAAEAVNKYVLVDMFAKACTGQMTPKESVEWATKEYEQIAKKRRT